MILEIVLSIQYALMRSLDGDLLWHSLAASPKDYDMCLHETQLASVLLHEDGWSLAMPTDLSCSYGFGIYVPEPALCWDSSRKTLTSR